MDNRKILVILLFLGSAALLSIGGMLLARRQLFGFLVLGFGIWYLVRTYRTYQNVNR